MSFIRRCKVTLFFHASMWVNSSKYVGKFVFFSFFAVSSAFFRNFAGEKRKKTRKNTQTNWGENRREPKYVFAKHGFRRGGTTRGFYCFL